MLQFTWKKVAPLAGAWIEILLGAVVSGAAAVAPLAGAWIEIAGAVSPSCIRGVAPLAGAWIEITTYTKRSVAAKVVAPLAGAWIEIHLFSVVDQMAGSLPSRERGLKLLLMLMILWHVSSLPSRERGLKYPRHAYGQQQPRRSPRGSVD